MNLRIDEFFNKSSGWQSEMKILRKIILSCKLDEDVKWGKPCYSHNNSNIVIIQPFKEYCALLFFKGILLSDPDHILVKTGENTHVGRQVRFTTEKEILEKEAILRAYVFEAIEVEKAGLKVPFQNVSEFEFPEEFQVKLNKTPILKKSFEALTPGRQKAYLIYFSQAKQSKTRESRINKYIPMILNGKGMND